MGVCKVEGCNGKHEARGYCSRHYTQMRKFGKVYRTRFDSNEIIVRGDIAEVVLYNLNGKEIARAIIDIEDAGKIKNHKWHMTAKGYVVTNVKEGLTGIQHIVTGLVPGGEKDIDHKNRNKLNNRKFNLRICTHTKNTWNAGKQKNNTSGFKGVYWAKGNKKWAAGITANHRRFFLGLFKKREEAAQAYNKAAIKYHGEFAYTNNV